MIDLITLGNLCFSSLMIKNNVYFSNTNFIFEYAISNFRRAFIRPGTVINARRKVCRRLPL